MNNIKVYFKNAVIALLVSTLFSVLSDISSVDSFFIYLLVFVSSNQISMMETLDLSL